MHTIKEIKQRSLRHNHEDQKRVTFFASKVSIYFSFIFVNLGLSANHVTFLFFITGLIGSLFVFSFSFGSIIIAYTLYRLHIIFDVCDGEVARFNKQYSINGAYWDYMIHAMLYPLFFIGMCFAAYSKFGNPFFLLLSSFGALFVSLLLAVKNNYFRAMFFSGKQIDDWKKNNTKMSDDNFNVFNLATLIVSFEGLFVFYIFLYLFKNEFLYISLFSAYIILFGLVVAIKFLSLSKKGFYITRS